MTHLHRSSKTGRDSLRTRMSSNLNDAVRLKEQQPDGDSSLDRRISELRWTMVCVLVPLVLAVLLTETSASSSGGEQEASPCPPPWTLFGRRCFAFFPVWSSWSAANALCSQTGGSLATLHTTLERQFIHQLASTHTSVWLGAYQLEQNGTWFWTEDVSRQDQKTCMQMEPKSGELQGVPCGELRFYVCSTSASSNFLPKDRKPVDPALPDVSLFDVVWGYSDSLAEEILRSSSFLRELRSGHMTRSCYTSFMQQEALYLHRVSGTLEALISGLREADDMRSLLLDTLKHYSSRNQSLLASPPSPPPQWLQSSLRSFHSVVMEEPVYWLVALSARASLRNFLFEKQHLAECEAAVPSEADSLYREWREESLKEVTWTQRYREVLKGRHDQIDAFEAINIFREHMMNQKSFFKSVVCDVEDEK